MSLRLATLDEAARSALDCGRASYRLRAPLYRQGARRQLRHVPGSRNSLCEADRLRLK
jgi:hypothetical protein